MRSVPVQVYVCSTWSISGKTPALARVRFLLLYQKSVSVIMHDISRFAFSLSTRKNAYLQRQVHGKAKGTRNNNFCPLLVVRTTHPTVCDGTAIRPYCKQPLEHSKTSCSRSGSAHRLPPPLPSLLLSSPPPRHHAAVSSLSASS